MGLFSMPIDTKKWTGAVKKAGAGISEKSRRYFNPTEEEIKADTKRLNELAKREQAKVKYLSAKQKIQKMKQPPAPEPFKEYKQKPLQFEDLFK